MTRDFATPRRSAGVTLIELLVALSVLALCAMVLFEGLHFGIKVWGGARRRAEATEEVATTQGFLRSRMALLDPFRPTGPADAVRAVIGMRDSLEFSAPPPEAVGAGSLRYQVRLRASPGRRDFIVRWRRDWDGQIDRVAGPEWREEILLPDVTDIQYRYLGRDSTGSPVWRTDWTDDRPPEAVELAVTFPSADIRFWPAFTVQRKIDDDALCQFDVVSQRCRS